MTVLGLLLLQTRFGQLDIINVYPFKVSLVSELALSGIFRYYREKQWKCYEYLLHVHLPDIWPQSVCVFLLINVLLADVLVLGCACCFHDYLLCTVYLFYKNQLNTAIQRFRVYFICLFIQYISNYIKWVISVRIYVSRILHIVTV